MFRCGWIGSRQLSYWSHKGEILHNFENLLPFLIFCLRLSICLSLFVHPWLWCIFVVCLICQKKLWYSPYTVFYPKSLHSRFQCLNQPMCNCFFLSRAWLQSIFHKQKNFHMAIFCNSRKVLIPDNFVIFLFFRLNYSNFLCFFSVQFVFDTTILILFLYSPFIFGMKNTISCFFQQRFHTNPSIHFSCFVIQKYKFPIFNFKKQQTNKKPPVS